MIRLPVHAAQATDFDFTPDPRGTIKNMRNNGLTIPALLAETNDNSEEHGSTESHVFLIPEDGSSILKEIACVDNGNGMNLEKLRNALVIARHHEHVKAATGKFGVGLKNAIMGLGDEIYILTKTPGGECIAVKLDLRKMMEKNTFTPTRFYDNAQCTELFEDILPFFLVEKFASYSSGTAIYIKELHAHHKNDVRQIANDIQTEWSTTYTKTTMATKVCVPSIDLTLDIQSIDLFYKDSPEKLEYFSESEIRMYSTPTGPRFFEVLTSKRLLKKKGGRGAKGYEYIGGTPEAPEFYELIGPLDIRKGKKQIHAYSTDYFVRVQELPKYEFKSFHRRFVEMKEDAYEEEGKVPLLATFPNRRRGHYFSRNSRLVARCLTLDESMDDWFNRFRNDISFGEDMDDEFGVRVQKVMGDKIVLKSLNDAVRIIWRQETRVRIAIRKAERKAAGLADGDTISSYSDDDDASVVSKASKVSKVSKAGKAKVTPLDNFGLTKKKPSPTPAPPLEPVVEKEEEAPAPAPVVEEETPAPVAVVEEETPAPAPVLEEETPVPPSAPAPVQSNPTPVPLTPETQVGPKLQIIGPTTSSILQLQQGNTVLASVRGFGSAKGLRDWIESLHAVSGKSLLDIMKSLESMTI